MRIIHISDLHFWHFTLNPTRLMNKRLLGMANLVFNRAWKYRMEAMPWLVDRIRQARPDHLLITGDLTTTALEEEFQAVRRALGSLPQEPSSMTVIPGNHDRYTRDSAWDRLFEKYFADLAPAPAYPWLKRLDGDTGILGFDPCHYNPISAQGTILPQQLEEAAKQLDGAVPKIRRLVVACHYPVALPAGVIESHGHGLRGCRRLRDFLARQGPNLYCHGHIHASWAFSPEVLPRTICLDPGPALKKRKRSGVSCSMLEILLEGNDVEVRRHRLRRGTWEVDSLTQVPNFFGDKN